MTTVGGDCREQQLKFVESMASTVARRKRQTSGKARQIRREEPGRAQRLAAGGQKRRRYEQAELGTVKPGRTSRMCSFGSTAAIEAARSSARRFAIHHEQEPHAVVLEKNRAEASRPPRRIA
jgi:hypothetical protein